jgi:predicted RNA-binding protein YlqC (UPF0109 family)
MFELVDYLAKSIIADGYEIVLIEDDNDVEIKLSVDKNKIAKLIGKNGRTAKAMRSIVKAASHGTDKRYDVSIDEREQ